MIQNTVIVIEVFNHESRFSSSHNTIRVIKKNEMDKLAARMVEKRVVYRVLVGKTEGQPLGRPRCRWKNSIKIDLLEVGWGGMDWIDLAQNSDR